MKKISVLMPVYNEEVLLPYSLKNVLPYVDETIIVDGSPDGPSTDKTKDIIDKYSKQYNIKYLDGTFKLPNGGWDESAQRNAGLQNVTGDFLMPHCADMIYDDADMKLMRKAVDMFPDKKIFHCFFVEFFCDTNFIRLYRVPDNFNAWFPVPLIGDIPILSMRMNPYYDGGPCLQINTNELQNTDFVYVHRAIRYHYGWITPFKKQIEKHVRNVMLGAWKEFGDKLMANGEKNVYAWAINHVLSYDKIDCKYPYLGEQPDIMRGTNFSYTDGYNEALSQYESKFGREFYLEYSDWII